MKSHLSILAFGLALAAGHPAWAEQHGPHEHGAGQLQLAVEDDEIEIELTLPGVDAVGFEHAAETDADKRAVEAAAAKLQNGASLFRFPAAAGCHLEKAVVNLMTQEHDDDHGHKEHAHEKEHEHGKEHAHEHEKEHGKEHAHEHEKGHEKEHAHEHEEGHSAFRAHYHFHCKVPAAARPLDVHVFTAFPTLRELRALTLTAKGQGAKELTPDAASLTF